MKTVNSTIADDTRNHSLHDLVDKAIKGLSSIQLTHQSKITNRVSPALIIRTGEEDVLSSVIRSMLEALLSNATEGEIEVSATELFGRTVKVFVKDNNCYNTYAVACALQNVLPMAEQIGGFLNIMNQRQRITTIEFSFPLEKDEKHLEDDDQ